MLGQIYRNLKDVKANFMKNEIIALFKMNYMK